MNPDHEDPTVRDGWEVDPIPDLEDEDVTGDASAGVHVPQPNPNVNLDDSASIAEETRRTETEGLAAMISGLQAMVANLNARFDMMNASRRNSEDGSQTAETPLRGAGTVRFPEETHMPTTTADTPFTPHGSVYSETVVLDIPIMGYRKNATTVVLGGMPRADWTGLAGPSADTPDCKRYVPGTSAEERGYTKRCKIDNFKFSKNCDIYDLMSRLSTHAKSHGMDTELYFPDPNDPEKMLFIPEFYSRFNHLRCKTLGKEMMLKWDSYSKENNSALVTLLRNALDDKLRATLNPYLDFEDLPASIILMMICREIRPATLLSREKDREKLMKRSIKQFTGHDVKQFCLIVRIEFRQLEQANEITKRLMLWLVEKFFEIGAPGFSEELRRRYYTNIKDLIESLHDYNHSQLMTALRDNQYHWEQLLDEATALYEDLRDAGQWKWAPSNDTKASPQFYLNENGEEIQCFGCGNPGVKKPDCPNCKDKKNGQKHGTKTKSNNNKNQDKKKSIGPAPKDGEPPIKIFENRIYFWCAKCNNWESSHFPKDHGKNGTRLTTEQLIAIKKDFLNSNKVPPNFNFCEVVSEEGINL